ncbi:MAG: HAD family acid phosphatase [Pseudomonadota bacterium]|nr:HAD family acid phosphatase [Pseudomonadota bacterium]
MIERRIILAALAAATAGCATAPAPAPETAVPQSDLLNAALWMQGAVEYKAAALGVYALARIRLDEALADRKWTAAPNRQGAGYEKLPPAVIVDADETVLDNSAYQAMLARDYVEFSGPTWGAFVDSETARAVPGALEFARYAASKGVTIFYITNRDAVGEEATRANLKALGFPVSDDKDTIFTQGEREEWKPSAKGVRVAEAARGHRILLMIGDNLGDFTDDYKGTPAERLSVYERNRAHWGKDWLVVPNPAYGSWESSLFGGNYKLSPDERRRLKRETLEPWTAD